MAVLVASIGILVLFGLVLAGGVAVTWQAMGQAKLVEEDLTTARALLARAGGFESGKLSRRLCLVDQAQAHTLNAERRLGRWPLRQIGLVPLLGLHAALEQDLERVRAADCSRPRTAGDSSRGWRWTSGLDGASGMWTGLPHERGTHNSRISRSMRTTHASDRQRRQRT